MSKTTILVVEDDRHLMEGIRDILEINGYDVLTAAHGVHGLDVLRAQPAPPDLIVSDIMMPHMDGYEFFKAVRDVDEWIAIPFIFLTAKGERDDVRRGKRLGVEDYVVKPFDADDLLIAVAAKLDRKRQLDAVWKSEVADVKQRIITILNHEMRTPLTYLVAYADLLNQDADSLRSDDMRSFLRGINAGASRLRRLVENFILLVELETGEAQATYAWRKRPLRNYASILGDIRNKYLDLAKEQQVRLEVDIADDLPTAEADGEYLAAALECLVDNAIKFSDKPDSTVMLCASVKDDSLCLSVSDQGRGIPPHELEHIFQSFYQIDRDTYEDQGAGSGLAIVDGVVRLHGGSMTVNSAFGQGSTFTIQLPVLPVGSRAPHP